MKMILQVVDAVDGVIEFDAPDVEGCIIGRSEAQSPLPPDVDLVNFHARDRGVSRRHAVLVRFKGDIHLLDLGSVNGTFLNNRRLPPDTPTLLQEGDKIALGELQLILVRKDVS